MNLNKLQQPFSKHNWQYFYVFKMGFAHPNDRWVDLYIKLWC